MKRLLFVAILAASASACVEGNNPIQLLAAVPYDPTSCDRGTVDILNGSLNYNASTHYYMTFSLFSPLSSSSSSSSSSSNSNGFIGEEVILNYSTKQTSTSFKEESMPIYFVVEAGAQSDSSWIGLDLIGDEARKKLDALVPAAPDKLTLLVTVKLKGKLTSGKSAESNEVTFPIDITRADACPANQTALPDPSTPCYPGQDGTPFICG